MERFPDRDLIDGAVVLWQPGSATPREPSLLDTSNGSQSPSAQLVRTAERALTEQAGRGPQILEGAFGELAQLALPSGLGEQAVLIEEDIDAVGLSSAGERPLAVAADQPDDLGRDTRGSGAHGSPLGGHPRRRGRAPRARPRRLPEPGGKPRPRLGARPARADSSSPGRCHLTGGASPGVPGRGATGAGACRWAASRSLPLLAALLLLYLLAVTGIVARPAFPFDPGRFRVGAGQIVAMLLLASVIGAGYYAIRGWRVPAGLPHEVAAASLGLIAAVAVLLAWLANPYLALLLVPVAHVRLLDARRAGPLAWPLALGAIAVSLLPMAAAVLPRHRAARPGGRRRLALHPDGGGRPDRLFADAGPLPAVRITGGAGGAGRPPHLDASTIAPRASADDGDERRQTGRRSLPSHTGPSHDSQGDRVTQLKQQLAVGEYRVDADAVAREMLFKLQLASLSRRALVSYFTGRGARPPLARHDLIRTHNRS